MGLLEKYKTRLRELESQEKEIDYASPLTIGEIKGEIKICREIIADLEK